MVDLLHVSTALHETPPEVFDFKSSPDHKVPSQLSHDAKLRIWQKEKE
jgi:hypothetical protein